jgi:maltooligosyltrehalose trehalohydrolase
MLRRRRKRLCRRDDPVLCRQDRQSIDGAVFGPEALVLRHFTATDDDRLVVVNLGADLALVPAPEPLLAPVTDGRWTLRWSSDHPDYGGPGVLNPLTKQGWRIPSASATLFVATRKDEPEE